MDLDLKKMMKTCFWTGSDVSGSMIIFSISANLFISGGGAGGAGDRGVNCFSKNEEFTHDNSLT